jgi:hypothetical protein
MFIRSNSINDSTLYNLNSIGCIQKAKNDNKVIELFVNMKDFVYWHYTNEDERNKEYNNLISLLGDHCLIIDLVDESSKDLLLEEEEGE